MLLKLILLLTITPLVELYFLIKLSQMTSIGTTIVIIIATGLLGGFLARIEGLRVLGKIRREIEAGRPPGDSLLQGGMILVAGAVLLTPGLLTDFVGFCLLVPFTRRFMAAALKRKAKDMIEEDQENMHKKMGFGPIDDEPPPGAPPLEDEDKD